LNKKRFIAEFRGAIWIRRFIHRVTAYVHRPALALVRTVRPEPSVSPLAASNRSSAFDKEGRWRGLCT